MKHLTANENRIDIKSVPNPPSQITDLELINKIKKEGFMAYGEIVKRYNQRMFRVARSVIKDNSAAMDIVQESHIKAFKNISKFNAKGQFSAWISTITRNEALMYLRKNAKLYTMGQNEESIIENSQLKQIQSSSLNQPDDIFQNQQMQTMINQYIDRLSEKFRSVFILRAIEQCSTRETATILNINEITVKTRYFRSKVLLRKLIKDHVNSSDLQAYEFGNQHCDIVLFNVLSTLSKIEFNRGK